MSMRDRSLARYWVSPVLMTTIVAAALADGTPPSTTSTTKRGPTEASLTCRVRVLVAESGDVEVAQIVESTGTVRLDRQCLNATIARHIEPYTLGGMPVDRWVVIPITWMMGMPARKDAEFKATDPSRLPMFQDQDFNLGGPYYPEDALKQHAEGVCGMQITVSAEGEVDKILMTRSTGVAALDIACADAMYAARFKPAQRDGKPVPATSEVWLAWRLPK